MLVSQKTPLSRHRNLFAITFALVASLALTNCAEKEDKESAAAEPVTIPEASTVVVDSEPEEVHPAEAELTEAGCSFLTLFQVDGSTSYLLNCQDVHSEQEIQAQINALSSFVEKAKPESTPENTEEPAASEEENLSLIHI